jgi:hypothetical protein
VTSPTSPEKKARDRLRVSFGQYAIYDPEVGPDAVPPLPERIGNGAAVTATDGVCLVSGLHTGDIWITAETWTASPPLELDGWDDVVEVAYTATTDAALVGELDGDSRDDLPNLLASGPGTYRLRISVRGRAAGQKLDHLKRDEDPVEEHRLQMWPADLADETIHKATDEVGAYWRSGG